MLDDLKVGFVSATSSIKRGNKKTTFFIIFVLALIFMNLVFLPSLINGMMSLFVGAVQDYTYGNIIVEPSAENHFINNAENVLMKIRGVNGVTDATQRLESGGSLRYNQKVVGANILGIVPSGEERVSNYPKIVKYGEFLGELSRNEILIGSMIAGVGTGSEIYDNLKGMEIGSLINVTYSNGVQRQYKVRGIYEGNTELTDLGAIVHYKELESVLGIDNQNKASTIIIKINPGEQEAEIKKKIIDAGVNEKVSTWQEKAETLLKQALQSMGIFSIMSELVSLIIGAALIFIIIYIHTLNRKREIGILKAVGISPHSIVISYIFISFFYVILGIFLGLIMFFSLILYFQANPLVFYETLSVVPAVDLTALAGSAFIMIIMGVIAGFLPAWFVTRQDILKSIWGN